MATRFQPGSASAPNPDAHEGKFLMWSKLAADMARLLIAFQEPRLAPIAVAPSLPAEGPRRFQLRIFGPGPGGEEFVPGTAMKIIPPADLEKLSTEELTKYYRARVAHPQFGPARPLEISSDSPAATSVASPAIEQAPPLAEVARTEPPVSTAPVEVAEREAEEPETDVVEVVEAPQPAPANVVLLDPMAHAMARAARAAALHPGRPKLDAWPPA
jgi:hypothetical protein